MNIEEQIILFNHKWWEEINSIKSGMTWYFAVLYTPAKQYYTNFET